jgi:endonuclease YncB( thermonuclease family)
MYTSRKRATPLIPILIVIAAIALWVFDAYRLFDPEQAPKKTSAQTQQQSGNYETFSACRLVNEKSNDGDSFRVRLPDGRKEIIRLYFVDCPESDFKSYGGGRNNHQRIAEQAAELNGISPEQAVEIGKKARKFTISHLSKAPFTVHTNWDSPYNDQRYHGFIEINYNGNSRFLHELLIAKGYARIHTKGAELPDGTSQKSQKNKLLKIQQSAKSSKLGAWSF